MPVTPEQMQDINNLQARMLANVAAGKPSWEGLTEEEITNALSFMRSPRAAAGAAGGKAKAEKAPKAAKQKEPPLIIVAASPETKSKLAALLDDE